MVDRIMLKVILILIGIAIYWVRQNTSTYKRVHTPLGPKKVTGVVHFVQNILFRVLIKNQLNRISIRMFSNIQLHFLNSCSDYLFETQDRSQSNMYPRLVLIAKLLDPLTLFSILILPSRSLSSFMPNLTKHYIDERNLLTAPRNLIRSFAQSIVEMSGRAQLSAINTIYGDSRKV